MSLSKPLALLSCQFALCTLKETLMRKEVAFIGSLLLNVLIFLEETEHRPRRQLNKWRYELLK